VAILAGVIFMPGPPQKAPPPKPAPVPKVVVTPPRPPAAPPPPPAAVVPPAPAHLPPSPRPVRRRSPHAGMSQAALEEMKQSYQKATRAFDLSNYDEAIAAYKHTYELGGDAAMLYNIAQSLRLGHKPDEAVMYYRRYLSRAPDAPNRKYVQARIAELTGGGETAPPLPSPR
jgi:hypothetical protein